MNLVRNLILLVMLSLCSSMYGQDEFSISGYIKDKESGEALISATITVDGTTIGTVTNEYGFFSLTLPNDTFDVTISYLGYEMKTQSVHAGNTGDLNFELSNDGYAVEEVNYSYKASIMKEEHNSSQMSNVRIPIATLKKIPSLGGEADVIKVVQLMPGVQKGGEGGTNMFVRGGDADQNLVLLDEATVYNLGHLFGFFSVFNPDVIRDINLYKGAFPSVYGGRLSSILDIRMNDGNVNKFHGAGGIGILSSRLTLEGPIQKGKSSFLISGRRTYIDQLSKLIGEQYHIPYYFYDLNAKLNFKLSEKDRLFISTYHGNDILSIKESSDGDGNEEEAFNLDFGFSLGNTTQTVRWNRLINDQLFVNTSFIHTQFDYDINGKFTDNSLLIKSSVRDIGVKNLWEYYPSTTNSYKFGFQVINHLFRPNIVSTSGEISDFLKNKKGAKLNTSELGLFAQNTRQLSDKLELNLGIRMSAGLVKDKAYLNPEPRVALRYSLSELDNIKASYSRMKQYMHLVSSSTVALPTDLWYPISKDIKPQTSDQIALGYSRMLTEKINLTVEGYYKWMYNLTEYREGANLILNDQFESELLQGTGKAYGAEVLVKKEKGKLTGWVGYTLGWSWRYFDELNKGNRFPAKYDRRHNLNIVCNYELSKRWDVSALWTYASGARFTPITGTYVMPNAEMTGVEFLPIYADKNSVAMSPSHRMDINFILKAKEEKKLKGEWHFGAYNLYNRATPYRVNVDTENGGYTQPGLFGLIFSVAYNFKF